MRGDKENKEQAPSFSCSRNHFFLNFSWKKYIVIFPAVHCKQIDFEVICCALQSKSFTCKSNFNPFNESKEKNLRRSELFKKSAFGATLDLIYPRKISPNCPFGATLDLFYHKKKKYPPPPLSFRSYLVLFYPGKKIFPL